MGEVTGKVMVPEKLLEVLKHEGVVAMVTQGQDDLHMVNTWNSYVRATNDGRLLFPAGGMKVTEANLAVNNRVQVTLGSREVEGLMGLGTGFRVKGTAALITDGSEFDEIKQEYPWARAVVEITAESITQTL
jgi:hypothetical protein